MSTQTKNLGLIKPGLDDKVDIGDLNQNFDAIDDLLVDATEIKKGLMSSEDKTKLNQMSPEDINKKADKTYVDNQNALLQEQVSLKADTTYVDTELNKKADTTYVDTELNKKADSTYLTAELGKKSDTTYVDAELGKKADTTYVDTELGKKTSKTYVDTALEKKADKTYVDTELEKKADTSYVNDNFANALKGKEFGSVISVDDVSPIVHSVKCKAEGKNLADVSKMELGLYTDEKFTVGNKKEPFHSFKAYLEKGTYTINSKDKGIVLLRFIADNKFITKYQTVPFTFTTTTDDYVGFGFRRIDEKPLDNTEEIQINRGSEATPYIPYVDVSNTNVNVCGKNLIDTSDFTVLSHDLTIIPLDNGKILINGTTSTPFNTYKRFHFGTRLNGKTVTLSQTQYVTESNKVLLFVQGIIETPNGAQYMNASWESVTKTIPSDALDFTVQIQAGNSSMVGTMNNLEIGYQLTAEKSTDFEPYINGGTYTPTTDGTVNGIKSIAPNMTILSDTDGVNIEAEYNRDINKAFEKLTNTIISLGGNV